MKLKYKKMICAGLTAVLLMTGSTTAIAGESLSSVFPAAGNSRALNEGVSVTTIKTRQPQSDSSSEDSKKSTKENNTDKSVETVLSQAGDSISMSSKTYSSSASSSSSVKDDDVDEEGTESSTVTRTSSSEPELLTVGGHRQDHLLKQEL